jgi:heme/copper-type cytochrome/quinol oxidase subunit 3
MNILTEPRAMSRFSNGKVALSIILLSESVFFATMLVAYIALRKQASWPVEHTLVRLIIPLANTAILLFSAISAGRGTVSIRNGKTSASQGWQMLTLLLGLVFVTVQIYEFSHAGMHINDQAFGGVFFTLMGFHGLHVLAGVVFLIINLARTRLSDFSPAHYEAVELGTWFWYYVTAVWIVLFAALYLL